MALQRIFINICLVFTNDSILAALCQMRESADADERVEFTELFNLFNLSEEDSDKEVEEQPVRLLKIVVATDRFSSEANSKPFSNSRQTKGSFSWDSDCSVGLIRSWINENV